MPDADEGTHHRIVPEHTTGELALPVFAHCRWSEGRLSQSLALLQQGQLTDCVLKVVFEKDVRWW
ncbi:MULTISPECIES: hypothetical protein [unclassified Streptomyces]|uniref:hypothetical protein n=1 Tax=unclassified Streptomyces TaxID=2593676 RepID=UPI00114C8F6C|nr:MULTISPECIES: hypothetical protein [unclassified Streptomyces]MYZ36788.1 hypothetical protein [Streptomyces sp. SID4917]